MIFDPGETPPGSPKHSIAGGKASDGEHSEVLLPGRSPDGAETSVADPVEAALAVGLAEASRAGRWEVVGVLARELEARRLARQQPNVVPLRSVARREGR